MRRLIFILTFFVLTNIVNAVDYYFSASQGDDNNNGTQYSPWQSLAKMQLTINSAAPGDRILLKRDDVWLQAYLYFTSKTNITINAYGSGEMPILSGGKIISMNNQGGNIWKGIDVYLPNASGDVRFCGYISNNWNFKNVGQEPDSGYWNQINSGSATGLTDNSEAWANDYWIGGYACIAGIGSADWLLPTGKILDNNATTLTFDNLTWECTAAPGALHQMYYVIANHKNTLDNQWEWAQINDSLWLYSTAAPGTVRASVVNNVIEIINSTVTIKNIEINHAILSGIRITGSASTVDADSCIIRGCGRNAIRSSSDLPPPDFTTPGGRVKFKRGQVDHIEAIAFHNAHSNGGSEIDSNYIFMIGYNVLSNALNTIFNGGAFETNAVCLWRSVDDANYFRRNYLHNVRAGVVMHYAYPTDCKYFVNDNYCNGYGGYIGDWGWTYTGNDLYSTKRRQIDNNIIINAHTRNDALDGSINKSLAYSHAFYLDLQSYGFRYDSNTVQNANNFFYNNSSAYDTLRYNNVINASKDIDFDYIFDNYLIFDTVLSIPIGGGMLSNNIITYNNLIMDGESDIRAIGYHGYVSWYPVNFTIDYNNYVTNVPNHDLFHMYKDWGGSNLYYTLAEWQGATSYDDNSVVRNRNVEAVKVFKNWSATGRYFQLGTANYTSITGASVVDSVFVRPFYSTPLFWSSGDSATVDPETYIDTTLIPMYSGILGGEEDTCDYYITTYDTVSVADSTQFSFDNNFTADFGSATITNHSTTFTNNGALVCQGTHTVNADILNSWFETSEIELQDSFNLVLNYRSWHTTGTIYANRGSSGSGFTLNRNGSVLEFITDNGAGGVQTLYSDAVISNGICYLIDIRIYRSAGVGLIFINGVDETASGDIRTDFELVSTLGFGGNNTGGNKNWSYIDRFKYSTFSTEIISTDSCVVSIQDTLTASDTIWARDYDFYYYAGQDINYDYGGCSPDTLFQVCETNYNNYIGYYNIDFNGENIIEYHGAKGNPENWYIELHLDSIDGQLIGTIVFDIYNSCVSEYTTVTAVTGIRDLYLVPPSMLPETNCVSFNFIRFYTVLPSENNWSSGNWGSENWKF